MDNIDFEGTATEQQTTAGGQGNQEEATSLDGKEEVVDINKKEESVDNSNDTAKEQEEESEDSELVAGTNIEFEGNIYTVAENGDLVDKDGNVFKAAADVKAWMDSLDSEEDNTFDITAIQNAVGIEVTDEDGKPVEFANDPEGVKAYVQSVIELKSKDIQEGAINKLYNDNPLIKEFVDYVNVTGTYQGFGQLPNREGIQIDKDNVEQQKYIIKTAAQEFGNKSVTDQYLKYLQDSGNLYSEAQAQLEALQEKDRNYREEVRKQAEANRKAEQDAVVKYFQNVNNVINSGTIAGYKIPENFVKEVDGKKVTYNRNDFYDYVSKQNVVDADGNRITAYQRDLDALSDTDLLNQELLQAYLMFSGGSYKDLVNMAVQEEKVRVLKLKSKQQRNSKTIKVVKPAAEKAKMEDIVL